MYLSEHAKADGDPSYLFFENRQGFNFVTLDRLNSADVVQKFEYNNSTQQIDPSGGSNRDLIQDYKRITEFHTPTTFDYMDKVGSGAFGSTMLFMDLTTKKYFNLKYSMLFAQDIDNPDSIKNLMLKM